MHKTKVLIIVVVLSVSLGIVYLYNSTKPPKAEQTTAALNQKVADAQKKKDVEILLSREPMAASLIYGALLRRANKGDPLAFKRAKELVDSDDGLIKSAAIEVMGFVEDEESLPVLNHYLLSKNIRLRMSAIKALGHRKSEDRYKILGKELQKKQSLQQYLVIYEVMYLSQNLVSEKSNLISKTFKMYEAGKHKGKTEILELIIKLDPQNQKVIGIAKQGISGPDGTARERAFFIKHLARTESSYIKSRAQNLYLNASFAERKALLSVFSRLCLAQPLHDLKSWEVVTNNKVLLMKIYSMASSLGSSEAKAFLGEALAKEELKIEVKKHVQDLIKTFINQPLGNSNCQTQNNK